MTDFATPQTSASSAGGPLLVPRINVQAFCVTPQTEEALRAAFADRRMSRANGTVSSGGIPAAVKQYQTQSTPNLLIVESNDPREALLASLAALADVCQAETKVVVIGHLNDVILYRELMRQGVSDYAVAPVSAIQVLEVISTLYGGEKAPVGRVIAFAGVKGGTGSSTVAHNCAFEIARATATDTVIVDLDLAYGTAALDFNTDVAGGIMEALSQPERVDALLLDRLLVRLGDKLSLLGGPGGIDRDFVVEPRAIETIIAALRTSIPTIVLDVPSIWAPWVRYTLLHSDHVVLTVEPELASLRNARTLIEMLRTARPNDPPPSVVLNRAGIPKRPEISAADFHKALGVELAASIPFDPENFGAALNNGRVLLDFAPRSNAATALRRLATAMAGADRITKPAKPGASLLSKVWKGRKR